MGTYHKGFFCGGDYIYLNLIMCKDNMLIPSILKSYVLHGYYRYLIHPGMDITEAMIFQRLYWTVIIESVQKDVTNCDTCQCTKRPNKKYGR